MRFSTLVATHVQSILMHMQEPDRKAREELSESAQRSFNALLSFPSANMMPKDWEALRAMENLLSSLS